MVDRRAHATGLECSHEFVGVARALLGDRQDAHLLGVEPAGERSREVLDEHTDEALHRAEWRAVDHHRTVRLVVLPRVGEVEADGQVVVDLHGAELPRTTDHILHNKVDLRAVERSLAWLLAERDTERLCSVAAGLLSFIPVCRIADVLRSVRIAQADAHAVLVHAKRCENDLHE